MELKWKNWEADLTKTMIKDVLFLNMSHNTLGVNVSLHISCTCEAAVVLFWEQDLFSLSKKIPCKTQKMIK